MEPDIEARRKVRIHDLARSRGWRVELRFPLGGEGAYLVDGGGRRIVVKWWPDTDPVAIRFSTALDRAERLRAVGFPLPAVVETVKFNDGLFVCHEYVPAQTADTVTPALIDQFVELNQLARGIGDMSPDWIESLREKSRKEAEDLTPRHPDVAELAERCIATMHQLPKGVPRLDDVCTCDYGAHNALVVDDRVVAIVDWEAACDGDSGFDLLFMHWDLVCWGRGTPTAAQRAVKHVERMVAPESAAAYAAALAIQNLHWALDSKQYEARVRGAVAQFTDKWMR